MKNQLLPHFYWIHTRYLKPELDFDWRLAQTSFPAVLTFSYDKIPDKVVRTVNWNYFKLSITHNLGKWSVL